MVREASSLLYIGSSRGLERTLIPDTGIRGAFMSMAPPSSVSGLARLAVASVRSLALLMRTRPRVTFATGGYVSIPASLASWVLRIPVVVFLPDVVPGKAVSTLVPLARRIVASTEDSLGYLPMDKSVVTGYPVRDSFLQTSKGVARRHLKIPLNSTVLGVLGGSLGARNINAAIAACLPELLARYHVIHVCGQQRYEEARAAADRLSPGEAQRYHLFPYLHDPDIAHAFAASDLVVCRSGASVLGELPAVGTPAVLVPLPIPGVHQRQNAEYLAKRDAAVIVDDDDLGRELAGVLQSLLGDRARLDRMAASSRRLAHPHAAEAIAAVVQELAS